MEEKNYTVPLDYTVLAPRGKRFVNYLIDLPVQYIIGILLSLFAVLLYNVFDSPFLINWIAQMNTIQKLLLHSLIVILYYGIFETTTSRSLGKLITGTKVIIENGSKPNPKVILQRTLSRLIPFEAFSFFAEDSRGWHDTISQTYVVDVKKYNEALQLKRSFDDIGNSETINNIS